VNQLRVYKTDNVVLSEKELSEIKSKLDTIESLIDRLSELLSPMLLFLYGAMFYDLVTCLYFTLRSIELSAYFGKKFIAANLGLFGNVIRLIYICFFAERLVNQVYFEELNKLAQYILISYLFYYNLRIRRFLKRWISYPILKTQILR